MTIQNLAERTQFATEIVRTGFGLAEARQRSTSVRMKSASEDAKDHASFVTEADLEVEAFLTAAIRERFPGDAILGEEGAGHTEGFDGQPTWLLDPIDGTGNYSRRISPWATSAALLINGSPVLAAVAVEGVVFATNIELPGVLRDGELLPPTLVRQQREWIVSYECFHWFDDGHELARHLWSAVHGTHGLSSAIGQSIYVLEGRIDGFLHPGLALWDHAGITLLAEKAGLCATRWDGTSCFPGVWNTATHSFQKYLKRQYAFDLIVAPPPIHAILQKVVSAYAGRRENP